MNAVTRRFVYTDRYQLSYFQYQLVHVEDNGQPACHHRLKEPKYIDLTVDEYLQKTDRSSWSRRAELHLCIYCKGLFSLIETVRRWRWE